MHFLKVPQGLLLGTLLFMISTVRILATILDFGLIPDSRKNSQVNSTILQLLGNALQAPRGFCKQLTGGSKGFRPSLFINMVNRIKRCCFL